MLIAIIATSTAEVVRPAKRRRTLYALATMMSSSRSRYEAKPSHGPSTVVSAMFGAIWPRRVQ